MLHLGTKGNINTDCIREISDIVINTDYIRDISDIVVTD